MVALLCALAAMSALAYIHRDDLLGGEGPAAAASPDDPFALCFAERARDIDAMVADNTITDVQATMFKSRAEALCRDLTGGNNRPPPGQ